MKDFRPRLKGQKKKAYLNLTKDEKRVLVIGDLHEPFCQMGIQSFVRSSTLYIIVMPLYLWRYH